MPTFLKRCNLAVKFKSWFTSPGGGGKSGVQADQMLTKVLKYAKVCCSDVTSSWEIPEAVRD